MIPVNWLLKLGLGEKAARLFGWLIPALLVFALCAALWARSEHFRAEAEAAENRLTRQVAEYRDAYRRAFATAWAQKQAEEARTRKAKEKADAAYIDALEDDRDRAAAYAAANRCVRAKADRPDQGAAGATDLPGAGGLAAQPQGAGDLAELVGITPADFNACTVNSRRLENAVSWGREYEAGAVATEAGK